LAHVIKLKQVAVAPMVAHYERIPEIERGFERINIDSARTDQNYNLRPNNVLERVHTGIEEHEAAAGKGIRKDANVLCDWVVTAPKDLRPEDNRVFFEAVTKFCEARYGEKNVLGAYVHMDEAQPHVHIPILPQVDGKMQASKMVNRADLQSFHGDLSHSIEQALGYKVSIELDETKKGEKQLSSLSQDEYKAAKATLEEMRKETEQLQAKNEKLQTENSKLHEANKTEFRRLELLRQRTQKLETVVQACRAVDSASVFNVSSRCRELVQQAHGLGEAIRQRTEACRSRIQAFKSKTRELIENRQTSLLERAREAREATRELNMRPRTRTHSRGYDLER
jgi:peroxiredoxin family protein